MSENKTILERDVEATLREAQVYLLNKIMASTSHIHGRAWAAAFALISGANVPAATAALVDFED